MRCMIARDHRAAAVAVGMRLGLYSDLFLRRLRGGFLLRLLKLGGFLVLRQRVLSKGRRGQQGQHHT